MDLVVRQHRSKADLLSALRAERARLDAAFARIPEPRWEIPGAMGEWTVKDMLAHIMAYEAWIAAQVDPALRASLPPDDPDVDMADTEARNLMFYRRYKDGPLAEVRAEAKRIIDSLLAGIEAAPEDALNAPVEFDEANNLNPTTWDALPMPVLWPLWMWIADQSYEHYPDHIADLDAWAAAG